MKNMKKRTSLKTRGTGSVPRLSVHRSNKFMNIQLIDDEKKQTLLGLSEKSLKLSKGTKLDHAKALGLEAAKKAISLKVKKIVFDRGRYRYHGRVKALAESLREGGLQF